MKQYLWRDRHGRPRVRKGGKTYPIRDANGVWHEPDTSEGDRIYWEILNGKRSEPKTSWSALIADYRISDRWTHLKPRTRSDYEKVLSYLIDKTGPKDATRLIRKDVIAAMDANRNRVRFANYIPQVMSVLMEHAIDLGWIKSNPAKGVRRMATPEAKMRPHVPWTDQAVAKWREQASPVPRLIFELGVGSVQRPGDWPKFRWNDLNGDTLSVTQGKTGRTLLLPCTDQLRSVLAVTAKCGMTILTLRDGRPMPYRRMAQIMRDERERLGLLAYDLHALRYRGVMELAWAGCDDDQIASYSGHASKDMIVKYAGEARQITRALQAAGKRK